MLEKEIRSYNKFGYCVIRGFISKKTLINLNIKIDKFFKEYSTKLKGKDINFSKNNKVNSMHDIDKFDPFFKKFAKQKFIINTVKKFLNSEVDFRKSEIFANRPH